MPEMKRTPALTLLLFTVAGIAGGLIVQFTLYWRGMSPLVPPMSLGLSMVVLGAILLWLGIALRRAVTKPDKAVNPFHAVRLLAGAQAAQLVGAMLGGFGGGLALQLLARTVPVTADTWLPMLVAFLGGIALVVCATITESLCQVPPGGSDDEHSAAEPNIDNSDPEAEPGTT